VDNTCRVTVGRLLEIRILGGFSSEADVDAQIARVRAAMSTVPVGERVVIAADWRQVPVMPASVAARAQALLTTTSERIERSGILAKPDAPTALMQFFRLVRESQHPSRQVLTSVEQLVTWLRPVLTAAELERLGAFLQE
jgi:hypothetical protein